MTRLAAPMDSPPAATGSTSGSSPTTAARSASTSAPGSSGWGSPARTCCSCDDRRRRLERILAALAAAADASRAQATARARLGDGRARPSRRRAGRRARRSAPTAFAAGGRIGGPRRALPRRRRRPCRTACRWRSSSRATEGRLRGAGSRAGARDRRSTWYAGRPTPTSRGAVGRACPARSARSACVPAARLTGRIGSSSRTGPGTIRRHDRPSDDPLRPADAGRRRGDRHACSPMRATRPARATSSSASNGSPSPEARVIVAEHDGELLGFIAIHALPRFEHDDWIVRILALVVDAGARERGVGRALMAEAERVGRELGAGFIELTAGHHRPEARQLYEIPRLRLVGDRVPEKEALTTGAAPAGAVGRRDRRGTGHPRARPGQALRRHPGRRRHRLRRGARARSSACSGRTARARPRRSRSSRACGRPTAARRSSSASTSPTGADALKPRIGVSLQTAALYPKLTVVEVIDLFRSFYPNPRPTDELIDLLELGERRNAQTQVLSGGQRQRLVDRPRPRQRPGARLPRRADDGAGSGGTTVAVGHRRRAQVGGALGAADDPLHGGGRGPVRSPGDHGPRPHPGDGDGQRAGLEAVQGAHGPPRRDRSARPTPSSPPCRRSSR